MQVIRSIIALGSVLLASNALAGDAAKGKAQAAVCVACHGVAGISPNPQWPNLAGQKDQYFINAMKAYRDGGRQDPIMSPLARNLTDEEIANLAAYYASLE